MINTAFAQTAGSAPAQDGTFGILMMVAMFIFFYFVIIRPQSKRAKEQKAMLSSLKKGDEVVTQGGIVGKVADFGDNFVLVEVANNTNIKVQKPSILMVLPKGSINSL